MNGQKADMVLTEFLSYYPLKQGLKQEISEIDAKRALDFYPTIH